MDDGNAKGKFVEFTAYLAAASLVTPEICEARLVMMPGRMLPPALHALAMPRSEHTDPESPQQPGAFWGPEVTLSTTTSVVQTGLFSVHVPK